MTNGENFSKSARPFANNGEIIFWTECADTGEIIEYRMPTYDAAKPVTIDETDILTAAEASAALKQEVHARNAWVRETPPLADTGKAYIVAEHINIIDPPELLPEDKQLL